MFVTLRARQNKSLTIKIQQQIAKFLTCFALKMQLKVGLNNLMFSIGFQMFKTWFFQMVLNTRET